MTPDFPVQLSRGIQNPLFILAILNNPREGSFYKMLIYKPPSFNFKMHIVFIF